MSNILFVCSGNMVRSQIAEAYYNLFTHSHGARSAGTAAVGIESASRRAIAVMKEEGMSLDGHTSKQLTPEMVEWADKIIVFEVPDAPSYLEESGKVERWDVADLGYGVEDSIAHDRVVRDDIKARVEALVAEEANHE